MKLAFTLIALFIFFFGSVIVMRATEYGFIMCDKALCSVGNTMKFLSKKTLKVFYLIVMSLFSLFKKTVIYRIVREQTIPALQYEQKTISYSDNARLTQSQSGNRVPVTIENSQQSH